jgi:plasmid stability protein
MRFSVDEAPQEAVTDRLIGEVGSSMANITVRKLDDEVLRRLEQQAAAHGRSMGSEARSILTAALARSGLAQAWLEATEDQRGEETTLPDGSPPRQVALG